MIRLVRLPRFASHFLEEKLCLAIRVRNKQILSQAIPMPTAVPNSSMNPDSRQAAVKPAILFLCTGNSARSVLAEFLFRSLSEGRFRVESAGSRPTGRVNPHAVSVLQKVYGIDASGARSKRLDELPGEPFTVVITLCDSAAAECPVWPYPAARAHWPFPDPAAVEGTPEEKEKAFADVARALEARFRTLLALPVERLSRPELETELRKLAT